MIQYAVAAFVGAFAALVVLAELPIPNKWVKYLVAFVIGVLLVVLLAWLLQQVAGAFARVHG